MSEISFDNVEFMSSPSPLPWGVISQHKIIKVLMKEGVVEESGFFEKGIFSNLNLSPLEEKLLITRSSTLLFRDWYYQKVTDFSYESGGHINTFLKYQVCGVKR